MCAAKREELGTEGDCDACDDCGAVGLGEREDADKESDESDCDSAGERCLCVLCVCAEDTGSGFSRVSEHALVMCLSSASFDSCIVFASLSEYKKLSSELSACDVSAESVVVVFAEFV